MQSFTSARIPPDASRRDPCAPGEESIDGPPDALAEAQYQEVLRRLRELEDGKDELIEWEQVRAQLLTRIDRRLS